MSPLVGAFGPNRNRNGWSLLGIVTRVRPTRGDTLIVDPDFLDHWRTRCVVDYLSDEMAPLYIMRLWGHCQERKSDRFLMPVRGLKAQCRFPGEAQLLEDALIEAGFIERDGDTIIVRGWAEKNASLLAAWANGAKGGRRKPIENPAGTHGLPDGNPTLTQTEPIREEKSREDKRRKEIEPPVGVSDVVWQSFLTLRKAKKAPVTAAALSLLEKEASKAGMSLEAALEVCCARGWTGFKAEWLADGSKAAQNMSVLTRGMTKANFWESSDEPKRLL